MAHVPADAARALPPPEQNECIIANPAFVVYSSIVSFYVPFIVTLLVYIKIYVVLRKRRKRVNTKRSSRAFRANLRAPLKVPSSPTASTPARCPGLARVCARWGRDAAAAWGPGWRGWAGRPVKARASVEQPPSAGWEAAGGRDRLGGEVSAWRPLDKAALSDPWAPLPSPPWPFPALQGLHRPLYLSTLHIPPCDLLPRLCLLLLLSPAPCLISLVSCKSSLCSALPEWTACGKGRSKGPGVRHSRVKSWHHPQFFVE